MREFIVNPYTAQHGLTVTKVNGDQVTGGATNGEVHDPIRRLVVAKLKAAGVPTVNVSDEGLLEEYVKVLRAPLQRQLDQANTRLALLGHQSV